MIKLYYDALSVSSQKVLLVLEELSIAWQGVPVNLLEGEQHSEAFTRLNDQAEVPVIEADGWAMSESAIIAEYLTTLIPEQQLLPASAQRRSEVQLLVSRISASLQQACGFITYAMLARPFLLLQPREQVLSAINKTLDPIARSNRVECYEKGTESPQFEQSIENFLIVIDKTERLLQDNGWLCGDNYTLADITLFPYLLRLEHLGLSEIIESYSSVFDWYQRVTARPSFTSAIANTLPDGIVAMGQEAGVAVKEKVDVMLR